MREREERGREREREREREKNKKKKEGIYPTTAAPSEPQVYDATKP